MIYNIIESIAANSSTNAKQAIIELNKDNELLKRCFYYAYNPRFNFWIKVSEFPKAGPEDISHDSFYVLDQLITRRVTGNAARDVVNSYMMRLTKQAQEIFVRIIHHDLRCGASDTLASRVWKNLVPEYPVLLCGKYDAKAETYLSKFENNVGFNVSLKEDGGRVLVTVDLDGVVTARSRNGSELNVYSIFDTDFNSYKGMVFDGELIIKNQDGTPDRKKSNGIYTKLVRNTATKAEVDQFTIVVWDIIPLDEYLSGVGTIAYSDRWARLQEISISLSHRVKLVEGKNVKTMSECLEFYEQMRARKQEGCIVKVLSAVWEDKRSKNSVKMKAEETADLICTGVEEGQGKYAGMIGNLICETSDGLLVTGVGTGLKDEDRLKDASFYIGKIWEICFNEVISAKSRSTKSLFLPVFKGPRPDKNVANTLAEIS